MDRADATDNANSRLADGGRDRGMGDLTRDARGGSRGAAGAPDREDSLDAATDMAGDRDAHDRVDGRAGNSAVRDVAGDRDGHQRVVSLPTSPRMARIPASIVRAICQVQVTVEAVKKSQRNQHGGYHFASTDDIYAATTRKMGEVGLVPLALEERAEIKRVEKDGKTVQWMHAEYSFVLATETDTWTHPNLKRTLYIQVTGPQTFQAAQSYVEKAFLRSLFKLPTGDMDLDSMPQAETEEDQNDLLAPRKRKSSSAAKKDGTDVVFNELRGAISGADGPADLALIRRNNNNVWEQMPPRWRQILDAEYEDRMADFDPDIQAAE